MKKSLFILFQHLVPQHLLSRLVGLLAECSQTQIKNFLIRRFISHYKVDMNEAERSSAESFRNFNDFFTRALKANARSIDTSTGSICSPADGAISEIGDLEFGRILQAKGRGYGLTTLLGGCEQRAAPFRNGKFATIYLSPRDYHRVHMPAAGKLTEAIYVPGDLYSVNQTTAENVDNLFARNERLVCIFETEQGPMAMILVGAMIVAGIETVWSGQVAPPQRQPLQLFSKQPAADIVLGKGDEMGRFKLGSTVILLFPEHTMNWSESLSAGTSLRMGEAIGLFSDNQES